jgi:hypothetical protein
MTVPITSLDQCSLEALKQALAERWPEAVCRPLESADLYFKTGLPELDRLFPAGGIPYGQMIEISGGVSSGKTSLLFAILAAITRDKEMVAYIDCGRSFFPRAAVTAGIDLSRLLLITPNQTIEGIRAAELLFDHRLIRCVAVDLVGMSTPFPFTLVHRLRTKTTRAKALVIFLTESSPALIPAGSVSLRLEVHCRTIGRLIVTVAKSRLCREGVTVEVCPYGG